MCYNPYLKEQIAQQIKLKTLPQTAIGFYLSHHNPRNRITDSFNYRSILAPSNAPCMLKPLNQSLSFQMGNFSSKGSKSKPSKKPGSPKEMGNKDYLSEFEKLKKDCKCYILRFLNLRDSAALAKTSKTNRAFVWSKIQKADYFLSTKETRDALKLAQNCHVARKLFLESSAIYGRFSLSEILSVVGKDVQLTTHLLTHSKFMEKLSADEISALAQLETIAKILIENNNLTPAHLVSICRQCPTIIHLLLKQTKRFKLNYEHLLQLSRINSDTAQAVYDFLIITLKDSEHLEHLLLQVIEPHPDLIDKHFKIPRTINWKALAYIKAAAMTSIDVAKSLVQPNAPRIGLTHKDKLIICCAHETLGLERIDSLLSESKQLLANNYVTATLLVNLGKHHLSIAKKIINDWICCAILQKHNLYIEFISHHYELCRELPQDINKYIRDSVITPVIIRQPKVGYDIASNARLYSVLTKGELFVLAQKYESIALYYIKEYMVYWGIDCNLVSLGEQYSNVALHLVTHKKVRNNIKMADSLYLIAQAHLTLAPYILTNCKLYPKHIEQLNRLILKYGLLQSEIAAHQLTDQISTVELQLNNNNNTP